MFRFFKYRTNVAASTVSVTTGAVMLSNVAEKSATEIYFDVFIVAPLYYFYQKIITTRCESVNPLVTKL
ncbi:hypothetical protein LDE05_01880 [Lactobacillus delbrueckii subsp. bulgaricus]|nr:hypothetical protein LDE05_01880 [Lactobacillus delbrueckii subsp. bulgaricus]